MHRILKIVFLVIILTACSIFIFKTSRPKVNIKQNINSNKNSSLIVAVGDIQCNIQTINFNNCASSQEATLAQTLNPSLILLLGDEQYGNGQVQDFINSLSPTWEKFGNKIHPVPGNHDYTKPHAQGYLDYFNKSGILKNNKISYYSFDFNKWHIIALDSNCSSVNGCQKGSPQYLWLEKDLNKNKSLCTLAYFHHPLFSSGQHGNNLQSKNFWDLLYKYNADIVLNGHEHVYERFALQSPNGELDKLRGIRQFTVGTGGGRLYQFINIKPNSEARNNSEYGILTLNLEENKYKWEFKSVNGGEFRDSGSGKCH